MIVESHSTRQQPFATNHPDIAIDTRIYYWESLGWLADDLGKDRRFEALVPMVHRRLLSEFRAVHTALSGIKVRFIANEDTAIGGSTRYLSMELSATLKTPGIDEERPLVSTTRVVLVPRPELRGTGKPYDRRSSITIAIRKLKLELFRELQRREALFGEFADRTQGQYNRWIRAVMPRPSRPVRLKKAA